MVRAGWIESGCMTTTNVALLEALGDCLESGDTLFQGLGKIEAAGGVAGSWTEGVRRSTRAEVPVAKALRDSNMFNHDELSLLPAEGTDAAVAAPLRAVVLRRRRSSDRRRAILWGLVGPFGFGALTVVLDPLPNLITGGAFVWPVPRGLLELGIVALVFDVRGVRRFFVADHRWRWPITGLYLAVMVLVTILLVRDFVHIA